MILDKYLKNFKEDNSGRSKAFYIKNKKFNNFKYIEKFLRKYSSIKKKDARVCLHSGYNDTLQDMILIQHSKNFYLPHKHINRYDSYFVLKGCLGVVIFDNKGNIINSIKLNKFSLYKSPKNQFHITIPVTNQVIYHEYRSGSFNRNTNCIFPPWSPKGKKNITKFKKKIIDKINEKKS